MIPWDAAFPVPVCTGIAFFGKLYKGCKGVSNRGSVESHCLRSIMAFHG